MRRAAEFAEDDGGGPRSEGNGNVRTWNLIWNAAAPTYTTTVTERFLEDDHLKWDVRVADSNSKVHFGIDGKIAWVQGPQK